MDPLFVELKDLTKGWNAHDLVPEPQQRQCRALGELLNTRGGIPLMQDAYYAATARNRAASVIAAYWDGIGDWRW